MPADKFNGTAKLSKGGNTLVIVVGGTWEIKDGYVNTKVESSSQPNMIPIGLTDADKIEKITDTELVTTNSKGKTRTAKRTK